MFQQPKTGEQLLSDGFVQDLEHILLLVGVHLMQYLT